jgi:serine/threonine protein kinase
VRDKIYTSQIKCTSTHRPPEAFDSTSDEFVFDSSFDIWSFGIIILETLSGIPMYLQPFMPKYYSNGFQSYDYSYDEKIYEFIISTNFDRMVRNIMPPELYHCFSMNPQLRPSIDRIISLLVTLGNNLYPEKFFLEMFDQNLSLKTKLDSMFNYKVISEIYNRHPHMVQLYPPMVAYATDNLINRLEKLLDQKFNDDYVNHAILLCWKFTNQDYKCPLEETLPSTNDDHTKKIIDEIITVTNGILFVVV